MSRCVDPRSDYDPQSGFWDEELDMWIKYNDMEMVL